jgi:amino acid transporter
VILRPLAVEWVVASTTGTAGAPGAADSAGSTGPAGSTPRPRIPLTIGDIAKRVFLGKPLITDDLHAEKLSNPVALGALSPDAISSTAYGPEQILIELLPHAGLAAFVLLLPITGVILLILVLVAASYQQVVMAYTRAGGSYIVARENFGPRVAQVAAAALLIDYVVTVAVQSAAGTVAVVSAIPRLGPYSLEITVGVVIAICYANLRGLKEAGMPFAVATYSFIVMIGLTIVVGVIRQIFWGLPVSDTHQQGMVDVHSGNGLVMGATILVLLRAFANGGSSLTGVEAISNTVDVFRKPQGSNARRVLTAMACVLGFLLAGVAYLAYATHATPFKSEYPSVLSQVGQAVFGGGAIGDVFFFLVQASTAAILFTGANTSFNGFPALASFVAEDRFLPRQLTKRGHRLVFSNGIIALTALSVALLVITGGSVNALVPFYAIGVFTGFSMAGYGMTKHHLTHREKGWRRRLAINLSAAILSTVVVGIFAVAKFTEGAWLVVVVFPILVLVLIRLNKEYRAEAAILEMFRTDRPELVKYARHRVFIFVNSLDLAVLEALRYGKGLRADELIAVHFMVDAAHAAQLRKRWEHFDLDTRLRAVDCPDRRVTRAAQLLVAKASKEHPDTNVTVLLPRRTYAPLLGRLLHDRTADKIARAVSLLPDAAATIVPYDVQSRIQEAYPERFEQRLARELDKLEAWVSQGEDQNVDAYEHPEHSDHPSSVITVAGLIPGQRATFEGRVSQVEDIAKGRRTFRWIVVGDDTGEISISFRPGHGGADIQPSQLLRIIGKPRQSGNRPITMVDPAYHIIEDPAKTDDTAESEDS